MLAAGFPDGAYYLAEHAQRCNFPDKKNINASYTHNMRDLIKVAHLELVRLGEAWTDPDFRNNWHLGQQWSEHSRYRRRDSEWLRRH